MKKKVTVLVYSPYDSVMGRRARGMFRFFKQVEFDIVYRRGSNLADSFRFLFRTLGNKSDIIYAIDPGLPSLIALFFAKISNRKIKSFLDVGDLPYIMVSKNEDPKYFYFLQKIYEAVVYLAESGLYKLVDEVVVRGHGHVSYLRENGFTKKINVIPDGTYCDKFKIKDVSKLKNKLDLDKYFTVGLVGNIFFSENQDTYYGKHIIEALKYLKDIPIKTLIVGSGQGLKKLRDKAEEYNVQDKILTAGKIPYEKITDYLNLMDIFDFSWINIEHTNIITSAKLPEAMATGRFIVATDIYEAKLLIPKIGNGIVLHYEGENDPSYPEKLAKALRKIYRDKKIIKKGVNGIAYAKKNYDYKVLSNKLEKIFKKTGA